MARDLRAKARQRGIQFLLPVDVVVADRFAANATHKVVSHDNVPESWRTLDIGPKTIDAFREALADAQTILWNGTLGVAVMPSFAKDTNALIQILTEHTQEGATTLICVRGAS